MLSSSATKYEQNQNTHAVFLDIGLPGTLPVVNKEFIKKAVDATISKDSFLLVRIIFIQIYQRVTKLVKLIAR